ncbi:MAG: homoserine kinase [Gammaproteobacteria bacterium]|nr:homoserine kinase [Gammaproteobacteria bacterium]
MPADTRIERSELAAFLIDYPVSAPSGIQRIASGGENTHYFISTPRGDYVLTLFEERPADEISYALDLMAYLAGHGVPSARPSADRHGRYLRTLRGKPAALVQRLPGARVDRAGLDHCRAIGAALAQLHDAGRGFTQRRENSHGPRAWKTLVAGLLPRVGADDAAVMREELRFQSLFRLSDLPRGVIHANLRRDKALFIGAGLAGIVGLHHACNDVLLYDVAIAANDWCSLPDGALDADRLHALLSAYRARRPLQPIERGAWPVLLRAAALRFWLSRLYDYHLPRPGVLVHAHDPEQFRDILALRAGVAAAPWID